MRNMKNSGIEWVGDIPENWKVIKTKYILVANDGGVWGSDPEDSAEDKIVLRSTEQTIDGKWSISTPAKRNLKGIPYSKCLIRPNDLLITKSSGSGLHIGKATLAGNEFLKNEYYFSNFLQRLRVNELKISPVYFWYILNSVFVREQFVYMQNSTSGIGNINSENIDNVIIPKPPLEEQRKIAEFLYEKCGEIDALIADIKTQIESLEQYKRSVITEAVTKGLNPSAEIKDSGAGWMPTVPKHWAVEKFKFHLRIRAQKNMGDKQVLSLYRDYGVVPKDSRDDNYNVTSEDTSTYRFVRVGDFVVNKMKAWQGSVAVSQYEGIVSPAYFVYEFTDNLFNKQYFHYLLRNKSYTTEFMRLSGGIRVGQWDLPAEALENILVLIPPIEEQKQIADYLDNKCAQIDELKSAKQSQIETLEAYKKSIIYEYVTGKKEVG